MSSPAMNDLERKANDALQRYQKDDGVKAANTEETVITSASNQPTAESEAAPQEPKVQRMTVPKFSESDAEGAYGAPPTEEEMAQAGQPTTNTVERGNETVDQFNLEAEAQPVQPQMETVATLTIASRRPEPEKPIGQRIDDPQPTVDPVPVTDNDETIIITSTARKEMDKMPESEQEKFLAAIMPDIANYQKDLVLKSGFTPDEAREAAQNRIKAKASEANTRFAQEHPDAVVLTIDKSQEKDLDLDPELMSKMVKARSIKLVMMENQELQNLTILKTPEDEKKSRTKMSHIRNIGGSVASYSVPLMSLGDYATFSGAQTSELSLCTHEPDDSFLDVIEKKATLLYRHFVRSTTRSRYNDKGEEMSYDEFCNWYHFDDIDMGVYAIIVASSMEEVESTYQCQNASCHNVFPITYNNKALLDLSGIPDEYKERLSAIDDARANVVKMMEIYTAANAYHRFKSPITENVYEFGSPTIAQVRSRITAAADTFTSQDVANIAIFTYINKIYIFDKDRGGYIPLDADEEPVDMLETIGLIHEIDIDLCAKWINEHKYHAEFRARHKCPKCGRDEIDRLDIDSMVFLHARAILVEIQ